MKLLKYFIIFISILVITNLFLSLAMEHLYKSVYIGMSGGKINHLLDNFEHVSVLSIGDSRCAHHIVPSKISDGAAYNLSHNGMSLIYHTGLIDLLINNEKIKIDTILLHIDFYEIFDPEIEKSRDIQNLKYYYNKNNWIKNEISGLSRFESAKYLMPTYKWNGKIMSIVNNKFKMIYTVPPKDGYDPKPPTERDSINVTLSYSKSINRDRKRSENISSNFQSNLAHIKNLCNANGIELICFTSPTYKTSISISNIKQIKVNNYFDSIGVVFLDYSKEYNLNSGLQSIWCWSDDQHLNHNGALIFTERLNNDLINTVPNNK